MTAWWESISLLEQIFFIIAAPATIVFLVQTALLIFGGGLDLPDSGLGSDVSGMNGAEMDFPDADHGDPGIQNADVSGLRLFSLSGILAFLTVSGWSGIVLLESGVNEVVSVLISFVLGVGALYATAFLIRGLLRLSETGNADYRKALGKTARVYLTIPAGGQGQGKINLMLGDAMGEFWAITDSQSPIPTGASVRVVDLSGGVYTVEQDA